MGVGSILTSWLRAKIPPTIGALPAGSCMLLLWRLLSGRRWSRARKCSEKRMDTDRYDGVAWHRQLTAHRDWLVRYCVTGHFKTSQPGRIKTGHSEVLNS